MHSAVLVESNVYKEVGCSSPRRNSSPKIAALKRSSLVWPSGGLVMLAQPLPVPLGDPPGKLILWPIRLNKHVDHCLEKEWVSTNKTRPAQDCRCPKTSFRIVGLPCGPDNAAENHDEF